MDNLSASVRTRMRFRFPVVCLRKLHRPRTVHLSLIFYTWPHTTVENPFFLPAFFLAEGIYILTHKIVLGKIVPKILI